jgi:3-keto-disaccharide hydrolase
MNKPKSHRNVVLTAALILVGLVFTTASVGAELNQPPKGFVALFNGKDLTGWKGLLKRPYDNPAKEATLSPEQLKELQKEANQNMAEHWKVQDGALVFDGKGRSLCTAKDYGDFEMLVDWKIEPGGDSGIYLRGSPQVQIWDTARTNVGAEVGSGGLYNNKKNPSKPKKVADKPVGQWNHFRIIMIGDLVTVMLNGQLVVDNVVMENYWERDKPIYPTGQIQLQSHGSHLYFRNIYIREIPREKGTNTLTEQEKADGFKLLFNGKNLDGWTGNKTSYFVKDGTIIIDPKKGGGGNLYTTDEYDNFIMRFEFRLTPGANNGIAIRAPLGGDAAYKGMEIQVLDDTSPRYTGWLKPYQHHGSIYGVVPAKPDHRKPIGDWNYEEIIARGKQITVKLNGETIVDANIEKASTPNTIDHKNHPGLERTTGHIGFCGHGDHVEFRNLRIKPLD